MKKTFAVVLAAMMLMTAFAGCGKKTEAPEETTSPIVTEAPAETTEAPAETTETTTETAPEAASEAPAASPAA